MKIETWGAASPTTHRPAGADLIVIGARGRSNLAYLLLGSTAERVLTRLPCSVLVVRSREG